MIGDHMAKIDSKFKYVSTHTVAHTTNVLKKTDGLFKLTSSVAQIPTAILDNKIKNPVEKLLKDFKISEVVPMTKESLLSKRLGKI